jgi:hypothetical protein
VMEGPRAPHFCRAIRGGKTVVSDVIGELASNELAGRCCTLKCCKNRAASPSCYSAYPRRSRSGGRFGRSSQDLQAQFNIGVDLGLVSGRPTVERGDNEVHRSCSIPGTEWSGLAPIKYATMLVPPFTFYRGAFLVMAPGPCHDADLGPPCRLGHMS